MASPYDYTRGLSGGQPQWMRASDYDMRQGAAPPISNPTPTLAYMNNMMNQQIASQQMPTFSSSGVSPLQMTRGTVAYPGGYAPPSPGIVATGSQSGFRPNPYYAQQHAEWQKATSGTPQPRKIYGQLERLLSDPSSITKHPAYKFMFNQGMQAFNRTAGAKRMRFSSNTGYGAQQFGQGLATTYTNDLVRQLLGGAGEERARWGQTEDNNRFWSPYKLADLEAQRPHPISIWQGNLG